MLYLSGGRAIICELPFEGKSEIRLRDLTASSTGHSDPSFQFELRPAQSHVSEIGQSQHRRVSTDRAIINETERIADLTDLTSIPRVQF
jgi:hypothetical protein